MTLNRHQLVDLAARYYSHSPLEPTPLPPPQSRERTAFYDAWERAERDERPGWLKTLEAIRNELPGISVAEATLGRSCASFRCVAYVREQALLAGAKLHTMVIGLRSVLAPVYGLAWSQEIITPRRTLTTRVCPWRASSIEIPEDLAPIADVIGKHIELHSGYQLLTVEIGRVRVPGIYVDPLDLDEATLFDALLDVDVSTNSQE